MGMQEAAQSNAPRPMGTVSALAGGGGPEPEQLGVGPSGGGGMGAGGIGNLPGRFEREDDDIPDTNPARSVELYDAADPELPANKGGPKRRLAAPKQEDEDEWGNDELNDDLLPM